MLLLFSCSVVSDSLQLRGLQHARLPRPLPSSGICSNSCLLSSWCQPTISFSVAFSSCPKSFPASGSSHQVAKVLVLQLQPQSFQWWECYRGFYKHVEERSHFLWDPSCWKIEDLYTFRAWAKLVANKMAQRGRGLHQLFSIVGPFIPREHLAMAGDVLDH